MLQTSPAAKAIAVIASGVLHAAAFAAAASSPGRDPVGGVQFLPIVVENVEDSPAPAQTSESLGTREPEGPVRVQSPARRPLARPASEPRVPPSAANVTTEETLPTIARPRGEEPPRFVMVMGSVSSTRGVVGAGPEEDGLADGDDAILPVEEVTTPARLLAGPPPRYPTQARANGVEADVRLEIVVDAAGRVRSTRVLGAPSADFDAAAREAVAGYRFAPATFQGRPVRVRMKWSVEFRLK